MRRRAASSLGFSGQAPSGLGSSEAGSHLGLASLSQWGGWHRDPLVVITRTTVMAYVEMIWAGLLQEGVARTCLARGLALAQATHPWRLVKDPISALVLTLRRIHWGFVDSNPFVLHSVAGNSFDVRM